MGCEASTHQLIYSVIALFVSLLLFLNFTLSRFFCGYFCPSSLATILAHKIKNPFLHFFVVASMALLLAFSTIAYFTPAEYLAVHFFDFGTATIFTGILATALTSIFLVFRGWYCSILCPYFFVSAILTQNLKQKFEFTNDSECIKCDKCVTICPIDNLDIKNGFDIRCVQCGLCADVCAKIMQPKHKESLIIKTDTTIFNSFSKFGYLFGIAILVTMLCLMAYILDGSFLDFCYFTNKNLH